MIKVDLSAIYRDYIACLNKQDVHLLICDPPYVASRLRFDCTPKGKFLSLHVNRKRVSFTENVFYEFRGEKIERVWSVIDKAAIEAQL
jgi:predicted ester cyclase